MPIFIPQNVVICGIADFYHFIAIMVCLDDVRSLEALMYTVFVHVMIASHVGANVGYQQYQRNDEVRTCVNVFVCHVGLDMCMYNAL